MNDDTKNNSNNQPAFTQPAAPNYNSQMGQQSQSAMQGAPNGLAGQPVMQPGSLGAQNSQNTNNVNLGQYPQAQPMAYPPRQPMDPAKKKRIILITSIVSASVILGIVATILIIVLNKVNYGPTYRTAKQLKPKIQEISLSYDCKDVINHIDSTYTSIDAYNGSIEECKGLFGSETDNLVKELGDTDGVKRDEDIKAHFEKFEAEYLAASTGNVKDLSDKLTLWQAWHGYVVTENNLSRKATDAEITAAANFLINSGNDTLKTYGETWLQKSIEVAAAYRAYDSSSWNSLNDYYARRDHYNSLRDQLTEWVAANEPDINALAPLNFNDTSKMYSEFNDLYRVVKETYEKNYDNSSNDCETLYGESVYCE